MDDTGLYVWAELVPNWITALAAAAAAVVFLWRRQDRREARALRDASIADGVAAVWATALVEGERRWGVLVMNRLDGAIHDVHVECSGNRSTRTLDHASLQPGEHFFESKPSGSRPWGFPRTTVEQVEHITESAKHRIDEVRFMQGGRTHVASSSL